MREEVPQIQATQGTCAGRRERQREREMAGGERERGSEGERERGREGERERGRERDSLIHTAQARAYLTYMLENIRETRAQARKVQELSGASPSLSLSLPLPLPLTLIFTLTLVMCVSFLLPPYSPDALHFSCASAPAHAMTGDLPLLFMYSWRVIYVLMASYLCIKWRVISGNYSSGEVLLLC